jgi:UDP-glucose 4-epimerase
MRIAITGASGNLGSATLRRLSRANHTLPLEQGPEPEPPELLGISRRTPGPSSTRPDSGGVSWLPLDLTDADAEARLTAAFEGCDAVVHLAWQLQPSWDLERLRAVNVTGTQRVLRAAVEAGVGHVVVASSVGAYSPGPKDRPVDESWPTGGVERSSYSRQKADNERFLDEIEALYPQVGITRLRPALIFQAAAGQEIKGLFLGPLVPSALAGRLALPVLPLPNAFRFQAVHADDVADAIAVALAGRVRGGLNVAADPILTPTDLARALGAGRAVPFPVVALRVLAAATWRAHLQPTEPGWIDLAANVPWMSTERLTGLGWRPSHTGVEALTEIVTGIRQRTNEPALPPLRGSGGNPGS